MTAIRKQFSVRSKVTGQLVPLVIDFYLTNRTTSVTVVCCKKSSSWNEPAYAHRECCGFEGSRGSDQLVMDYYPSKANRRDLALKLEEGFDKFSSSEVLEHGFLAPVMAENIAKWIRQHRKAMRFEETLKNAEAANRWFASSSRRLD